jgi:hypothetical protein
MALLLRLLKIRMKKKIIFSEVIKDKDEKEIIFSEEQKRCIINIDETNLSLDGSDGGRGGRSACTITMKHCNRPGTAQNKTSLPSSLMCASNAAGEAMPLHIMFSSDAKEGENYPIITSCQRHIWA